MSTWRRTKFNAQACFEDGLRFDSKKEAAYYKRLKVLKKATHDSDRVDFFLRQVPFDLPGGIKYRVDFQVFYCDGRIEFVDVKGFETKEFKMKKRMVENLYPVEIIIV
jgi:hypothetical protein